MAILTRTFAAEAERVQRSPLLTIVVSVAILYWARLFFITLITGIAISFILEPFVNLAMRARLPRSVASFVVCTLGLLVVYLLGLGSYTQLAALFDDLPAYTQRLGEITEGIEQRVGGVEQSMSRIMIPARQREREQAQQKVEATRQKRRKAAEPVLPPAPGAPGAPIPEVRIRSERKPLMAYAYEQIGSLYSVLLMVSFIPFLVYFMLSWRDHIYRSFLQFFEGEDRVVAAKSLQGIARMVRAFVVGNFMLGMLLAVASALAFWKLRLPYPLLVGPLSGFLSLIPYIGLPVAMLPPLAVGLTVLTTLPSYLAVVATVMALHLIALNVLYPKVVGARVHLNPLVVTVALMFWGFLWDAAGLVLAIPVTAGLKAVCDNVRGLRPYGKFLGD